LSNLNLDLDYFDHPKTKRLIGLLGRGAAELPIRIWCYCGKYHAESGNLTNYSPQEIESIAGWWGKSGEMIKAMEQVGFLENDGVSWRVKDWLQINGHLAMFKERAKKAALARWGMSEKCLLNATSIAQALYKQCPKPNQTKPNQIKEKIKKEKIRAGPFVKPTPQQVEDYARSIGAIVNGSKFCDSYEAKGWLVGRVPMKSWEAAVRTWARNAKEWAQTAKTEQPNPIQRQRERLADQKAMREIWKSAGMTPCHGKQFTEHDDQTFACAEANCMNLFDEKKELIKRE